MQKILLIILLVLILSGCYHQTSQQSPDSSPTDSSIVPITTIEEVVPTSDMFTSADLKREYAENAAYKITFDNAEVKGDLENLLLQENSLTIKQAGTYIFSGNGNDFSIIVDVSSSDKVNLVLRNLHLSVNNFAPIYVKSADKVFIILEGENTLSTLNEFQSQDENNVDGVIFAKDDITINGSGTLNIDSTQHGIVAKDDLKVVNAYINIDAMAHAISANNSVRIKEANLNLLAQKDGIKSNDEDAEKGYIYLEDAFIDIKSTGDGLSASSNIYLSNCQITHRSNTPTFSSTVSMKGIKANKCIYIVAGEYNISSTDDGVHANESIIISGADLCISSFDDGIHADISVEINDGSITINKSYEGIEAQNITINSGNIIVYASDDGINAAGGNDSSSNGGRGGQNSFNSNYHAYIEINGGNIYVNANGDGLDANGKLTITGGTIVIEGPSYSGNGALDYDSTGSITGGEIIAIGHSGMAMNFSSATQGSMLVTTASNMPANTLIKIYNDNGDLLLEFTSTKAFNSLLVSLPSFTVGQTYTIDIGGNVSKISLSSLIYGNKSSLPGGNRPRP